MVVPKKYRAEGDGNGARWENGGAYGNIQDDGENSEEILVAGDAEGGGRVDKNVQSMSGI